MQRMSQIFGSSVAAAAMCAVGGCTAFAPPSIDVQSVTVVETTDEAVLVEFTTMLNNPNDHPLELIEFDYVLSTGGGVVYRGRRDAQATVPAAGRWAVRLPAVIPRAAAGWDEWPAEAMAYDLRGTVLFLEPGALADVLMDAGVYQPRAGFAAAGQLTVR